MNNIPINEALYILEKSNPGLLAYYRKEFTYLQRKELEGGTTLGPKNKSLVNNWFLEKLEIIKRALIIQSHQLKTVNDKYKNNERRISKLNLISKILILISNSTILYLLIENLSNAIAFLIYIPAGLSFICSIITLMLTYLKKKYITFDQILVDTNEKIRSLEFLEVDLKMFDNTPILSEKATTLLNGCNAQILKISMILENTFSTED